MASSLHTDVVCEVITAAIRKTPQSSRAVKLKQLGNTILKIDDQECKFAASFDTFSLELVSYLNGKVHSEASRYKATSSKRQKLWSVFHNLLTNSTLTSLWKKFVKDLQMDIDDPLLEQSIYQVVFEACMFEYFSEFSTNTSGAGNEVTNQGVVSLTADELNVVRYVGRFVARSLLKKI